MKEFIYGKDDTQNIVGCEVRPDHTTLFLEDINGITTKTLLTKHWMLTGKLNSEKLQRLDGDLPLAYIYETTKKTDLYQLKSVCEDKDVPYYRAYDDKEANCSLV